MDRPDRRRITDFNIWRTDDGRIVLDFFGPDHHAAHVRRDDADAGVVMDDALFRLLRRAMVDFHA